MRRWLWALWICVPIIWIATVSAAPRYLMHAPNVDQRGLLQYQVQYEPRYSAPWAPQPQQQFSAQPRAHVYLLRGFMNIFSLGMDDLAVKIRSRGIDTTVRNHADADAVVGQIVARYRAGDNGPIILIGHSLGADAVVLVANALDRQSIPVALVILFDGTTEHSVPKNVALAINFTQRFYLRPGYDSHATISNIDLSNNPTIDHLSIDKSPSLQNEALNYVLQAAAISEGR